MESGEDAKHVWTAAELKKKIDDEVRNPCSMQCRINTAWNVSREVFDELLPTIVGGEIAAKDLETTWTCDKGSDSSRLLHVADAKDFDVKETERVFRKADKIDDERRVGKRARDRYTPPPVVWVLFAGPQPPGINTGAWHHQKSPTASSQPC